MPKTTVNKVDIASFHPARRMISSTAIFVMLWSILVIAMTAVWMLIPFCEWQTMKVASWPSSFLLLLLLIKNGTIEINKR